MMPGNRKIRPPAVCRWLVQFAAWIVPRRARSEWRAKWETALWNWWILVERGELAGHAQTELVRYYRRAFADAFWLRFNRQYFADFIRGPAFALLCGIAILSVTAILTGGFRATRALFVPLPLKDPGSLISLRYAGAANEPTGLPPRLIPLWRKKSSLLVDLAGYRYRANTRRAWVTPNFFSLMGTQAIAGRTFQEGDKDVAILSGDFWRKWFSSDPRVIGGTIPLDGRQYTIIGVLPDAFWAISWSIDVWTPLILEPAPAPGLPPLIGAVARVKHGVAEDKLRRELLDIGKAAGWHLPRPPHVRSFTTVSERPLFGPLIGIAFALVIGIVLVAMARPPIRRHGWRYWSFLVVKTLFVVVMVPLLWIEIGAATRALLADSNLNFLLTGVLFYFVFILGFGSALWWSFADQRRRCPVCLQRLAMPVRMGSWASVFEPVTTEFLCEQGHGSLCIRETETGEPDRWTELDSSWRELFEKKPK